MGFWTEAATTRDPKRNFRWIVRLGNYPNSATWYAKKCDRPSFSVNAAEHSFLNHTFKFPGKVTWDDINVELVDPVSPDALANTLAILEASGYQLPNNQNDISTISKQQAVTALGHMTIDMVDSQGNPIESWTVKQAWIGAVKMSALEYGNDDLSTISLTIKYDWAEANTLLASEPISRTVEGQTSQTVYPPKKEFFKP